MNVKIKGTGLAVRSSAILTALIVLSVGAMCATDGNDHGSDGAISDAELQAAVSEKMGDLSAEYDAVMMSEYGISYSEYCCVMDAFSGKALYISADGGVVTASIVEQTAAGKTMTDSELRGDELRVYIDSHTESLLVNYGVEVFSTMLGAAIGAVIGSAPGAAAGTIIGFLISPVLSELYSFVCEQSSMDNGIWIDIKVRGHFSIFGHTIYYSLPPGLWLFKGYGIQ